MKVEDMKHMADRLEFTFDLINTATGEKIARQPMTRRAARWANDSFRSADDQRRWVLMIPDARVDDLQEIAERAASKVSA